MRVIMNNNICCEENFDIKDEVKCFKCFTLDKTFPVCVIQQPLLSKSYFYADMYSTCFHFCFLKDLVE